MEVRVERAMARDGVERARVVERIAAQMDDETKRSRADFVILNDGQTPLIPQVEELIERLRNGD
jgi:dephospho-CoA kinase